MHRIVSIDIETTSLNVERGEVLELGMLMCETDTDQKQLHIVDSLRIVNVGNLHGQMDPVAIHMNAELFAEIAEIERGQFDWTNGYIFHNNTFYVKNNKRQVVLSMIDERLGGNKWTVIGKNAASFDIPFICYSFGFEFKQHLSHKVLDVGSMFCTHEDDYVPSLDECLARAGIKKEVRHKALDDAFDVLQCVAHFWGVKLNDKRSDQN